MRIVAGSAGGRRLVSPKDNRIRPTADKVKEAVFSIIGPNIYDSIVLDLFAGTGSLGLEALSRGAEFVTFVEKSPNSLRILKENIKLTGFVNRSEVLYTDALKALEGFERADRVFDLIFIDPPYRDNFYEKTLFSIEKCGIIRNGGLVIVEYPDSVKLDRGFCRLVPVKNKIYGSTAISIFTRGDDHEDGSISGKF
ncbi:MAG: 16S rRNA (guanine(966)-N(2))-methyltransferase RsmD [Bacillota bacterium]|nr:16S rRNA (guanine(966)-N(2))-methyltransferase RsmD [Bacillota bacterium]MDD3297513.1 16S rRNA (guanine(966)-N(2))-methyltransferase RsmD [Bacillota bacterium]MDD3851079.1 16S rRNA (guanine(966)-N(2))-methyltransferase RsmD [Bacillota bacterium]MDD4706909.1 16S rRNA (guanine(966)-N(2))-methyltransferase RsmD [Bacillota bacterium]